MLPTRAEDEVRWPKMKASLGIVVCAAITVGVIFAMIELAALTKPHISKFNTFKKLELAYGREHGLSPLTCTDRFGDIDEYYSELVATSNTQALTITAYIVLSAGVGAIGIGALCGVGVGSYALKKMMEEEHLHRRREAQGYDVVE